MSMIIICSSCSNSGAQAAHQGGAGLARWLRGAACQRLPSMVRALASPLTEASRPLAQQVTKALQDNSKSFSEQEIDGTIVNGTSLRARLTRDKAQNVFSPGSLTMGRLYYNALKMEFASAYSPAKRFSWASSGGWCC